MFWVAGVAFLFGVSEEQLGTHANGTKGQLEYRIGADLRLTLTNIHRGLHLSHAHFTSQHHTSHTHSTMHLQSSIDTTTPS